MEKQEGLLTSGSDGEKPTRPPAAYGSPVAVEVRV
jgi:hypothetical protein